MPLQLGSQCFDQLVDCGRVLPLRFQVGHQCFEEPGFYIEVHGIAFCVQENVLEDLFKFLAILAACEAFFQGEAPGRELAGKLLGYLLGEMDCLGGVKPL